MSLFIHRTLLFVAYGFSLYTIFSFDSDLAEKITLKDALSQVSFNLWNAYERGLATNPIVTKTVINVIIYLIGDWLSQTVFQGRNALKFDSIRTVKNGFIGLCFGPLVHWYYEFSDYILPVVGINRLYKIIMDQTIYLMTKVSIYIVAVGLLNGETIQDGLVNVKNKMKAITFTAWKFWPLVHCVTYTVIPSQHRILWVNCIDLVWNAILALMARRRNAVEPELEVKEIEQVKPEPDCENPSEDPQPLKII